MQKINNMIYHRSWKALTVLLLGLLFSGCPYGSLVPLNPPDEGVTDDALAGKWWTTEKRLTGLDSVELIFTRAEGPAYHIEHRVKKPDNTAGGGWSSDHYRAHITRVKGSNVLNVQESRENGALAEYLFFMYQVTGNTLKLSVVSDQVMKQRRDSSLALRSYFEANIGRKGFTEEERTFEKRK
jgi:hypothetical protein